jgi:hypothetical protein
MKYFINSQPKAGTYLAANILQSMSVEPTNIHVTPAGYHKYDPQRLEEGRSNPQNFFVSRNWTEAFHLVSQNQFMVGHIPYSETADILTHSWKRIILWRDAKTATESYERWQKESGRNKAFKDQTQIMFDWMDKYNIFVMRFEDMVGKNYSIIDDLQKYLYSDILFDSENILNRALNSPSLTKSTKRV